uniref:ABC transmembrane type-1 domain-containing protein n=1 Tax=Ascaris lumbricoides TaxID=6252 RepID=A0A0M3IRS8_ASCLU
MISLLCVKFESTLSGLKSETVGKVKWDEYPLKKGESLSESVEVKPPPDPLWKRTVKLLKILLPHVGLNLLLLTYIAMGALVFIWLEADNELQVSIGYVCKFIVMRTEHKILQIEYQMSAVN